MLLSSLKKTCGNCRYSCCKQDTSRHPSIGLLRQHCENEKYSQGQKYLSLTIHFDCHFSRRFAATEKYNSADYTEEMYLEDRKTGCCRFWAPEEGEKG